MPINTLHWLLGIAIAPSLILGCTAAPPPSPGVPTSVAQTPSLASPNAEQLPKEQGLQKTTLIQGLEHPWSMAWLPDGTLLITERPGRLRIVRKGVLDPTPVAGVPTVLAQGQGGLMEIALHPRFATNRTVYFTYAHGTSEANQTRLARAIFDGKALQNVQVIFEASPLKPGNQHFGSRIVWLPDETLLLAIGDGGNPPLILEGDLPRKQAQKLRSHLGKIVRLKADGTIPTDNPFVDNPQADPAVWSYGHRNIQGLAFNPLNQQVWATEHGSRGGDELNRVEAGKNYGWPVVTYSREYFGPEISSERSRPGMVDPKLYWTPSIAPSGLMIYTGDRFPGWKGDLLAGGLVSQDIRHIKYSAAGTVTTQQMIEIGQRVRDVRQGPDGLLYVLTDETNGALIQLAPKP
jgi:glucose/arabinose dehydrogenase